MTLNSTRPAWFPAPWGTALMLPCALRSSGTCPPEVIVSASNHHQAVLSTDLFPEVLHGFRVTLQGVLANDKEDWGLHVQEGIVHILKQGWVLESAGSHSVSTGPSWGAVPHSPHCSPHSYPSGAVHCQERKPKADDSCDILHH